MSIIYEAINDSICKRVAIKVLQPEFTSQESVVARFLTEARLVNQIAHPGLVSIFELGETSAGHPYIVMELLEGVTLGKLLLHQSRIGLPSVLCLLQQVAAALSASHAQRIVHRDLKPANIFLCRDRAVQGELRVKLLDFGVAKQIGRTDVDADDPALTRSGTFLGTPYYVAPEQIHDASQVTALADVYALGIILYQCLTGRMPFSGSSTSVLAGHLHEQPSRLRAIDPTIPQVVDDLCAAMLAKDPQARPLMSEVDRCFGLLLSDMAATTVRRSAEALFASSLFSIDRVPTFGANIGNEAPVSFRRKILGMVGGTVVLGGLTLLSLWFLQGRHRTELSVRESVDRLDGGAVDYANPAPVGTGTAGNAGSLGPLNPAPPSPLVTRDAVTPPGGSPQTSQPAGAVGTAVVHVAAPPRTVARPTVSASPATAGVNKGRPKPRDDSRRPVLPMAEQPPEKPIVKSDFTDDDIRVHN